jgi:hypothetical protein
MKRTALGILVAGVGFTACASAPPPHEREASSEASIRGAREVGAEKFPPAALHLKLAQEALERAKVLMRNGDNEEAGYTLLRAQADAELALALAREARTRADAQQVIDKARAIGGGPADAAKAPAQLNTTPAANPVK